MLSPLALGCLLPASLCLSGWLCSDRKRLINMSSRPGLLSRLLSQSICFSVSLRLARPCLFFCVRFHSLSVQYRRPRRFIVGIEVCFTSHIQTNKPTGRPTNQQAHRRTNTTSWKVSNEKRHQPASQPLKRASQPAAADWMKSFPTDIGSTLHCVGGFSSLVCVILIGRWRQFKQRHPMQLLTLPDSLGLAWLRSAHLIPIHSIQSTSISRAQPFRDSLPPLLFFSAVSELQTHRRRFTSKAAPPSRYKQAQLLRWTRRRQLTCYYLMIKDEIIIISIYPSISLSSCADQRQSSFNQVAWLACLSAAL